jgi:hypothetical protein
VTPARVIGLLLAFALLAPGDARAGVASMTVKDVGTEKYSLLQGMVSYRAADGEANDVRVEHADGAPLVVIRDTAGAQGGPGCESTSDPTVAVCRPPEGLSVALALGDGDDRAFAPGWIVDGGDGDDVIEADSAVGGSGRDVLHGRRVDGGPGSDELIGTPDPNDVASYAGRLVGRRSANRATRTGAPRSSAL